MMHKHIVLGIQTLTEDNVIVILSDVTILGVMHVLRDSLRGRSIPNSPDTMALAAVMNQFTCKPRFQNLAGMPIIAVDFNQRVVSIQGCHCPLEGGWNGSFDEYLASHA